jgi:hypothetical protein
MADGGENVLLQKENIFRKDEYLAIQAFVFCLLKKIMSNLELLNY